MASIYELRAGQLLTVPETDKTTQCKMCLEVAVPKLVKDQDDSPTIRLGDLYEYGNPITDPDTGKEDVEVYCAHYFCLLFSSGLEQRGQEDDEGLKGFLPVDVLREWRRGQRLKCHVCNQKYATVGCAHKSCRKTFHLPCAVRSRSLLQYCDQFSLYCHEHRPKQRPFAKPVKGSKNNEEEEEEGELSCGICYDDIDDRKDDLANIWSPCCNKWFHKPCVQRFADTSGYFFKCPLCNNREDYVEEMKRFGIYVPEKDADWEKGGGGNATDEGEAYESLLERHDNCDAEECVCPEGRKKDEDYTEWEIVLCWYCGARGVHVKCGNLPMQAEPIKWKCELCTETLKKMPPKRVHQFTPIKLNRKSSSKPLLADLLTRTTIKVGGVGGASQISFNVNERLKVGRWKTELRPHFVLSGTLKQEGRVHAEIKERVRLSRPSTSAPQSAPASTPTLPPPVTIQSSPAKAAKLPPSSPVNMRVSSPVKVSQTTSTPNAAKPPSKKKKRGTTSPLANQGLSKKKKTMLKMEPVKSSSPEKAPPPTSKSLTAEQLKAKHQKSILQYFTAKQH